MSEYTQPKTTKANLQKSQMFTQLKAIDVDLIEKQVMDQPTGESQLEVVSAFNQKRQFLVNQEIPKGSYKFGNTKRRSCFLPQEKHSEDKFYINTQQGDPRKSKKLDFECFLKCLELVARKALPTLQPGDAFVSLVQMKILPLYDAEVENDEQQEYVQFEQQLGQAFEILDHGSVIDVLSVVYKIVVPLFKEY